MGVLMVQRDANFNKNTDSAAFKCDGDEHCAEMIQDVCMIQD